MTPEGIRDSLLSGLPALFDCRPGLHGDVQVITPLQYPDGGFVDVFVVEDDGEYVVTDYGDAQGWLQMQSFRGDLTPEQEDLVAQACQGLGVDLDRGRMTLCCTNPSQLAPTILRMALAVVRVADVRNTFNVAGATADVATTSNGAGRQAERQPQQLSR